MTNYLLFIFAIVLFTQFNTMFEYGKHQLNKFFLEHNQIDPFSFSNLREITTVSFHLNLDIDIEKQIISGSITLKLKALQNANAVYLDENFLDIKKVLINSAPANFFINPNTTNPQQGRQLVITPINNDNKKDGEPAFKKGELITIIIDYSTTNQSTAISWLKPEQTMQKNYSYLYTQCESTHCRSIFPHQDSPSVKSTFTAYITIREPYIVFMSAHTKGFSILEQVPAIHQFQFEQSVPIPAYLVAINAGVLERKQASQRIFIIEEKVTNPSKNSSFADHQVFKEAESYLKSIEDYVQVKYPWDHFVFGITPPSFPYLGMENPLLTTINPSCLKEFNPYFNVFIHEMVHSWVGNLVTCNNWNNFWLNEGLTVFIERKVVQVLKGQNQWYLEAYCGNINLNKAYSLLSGERSVLTSLLLELQEWGMHSDDGVTAVPYEKGFQFWLYLEQKVFGEKGMQDFLKVYISNFQKKSLSSQDMVDFLIKYCNEQAEKKKQLMSDWKLIINKNNLMKLLKQEGPFDFSNKFNFTISSITTVKQMAEKFFNNFKQSGKSEDNLNSTFWSLPLKAQAIFLEEFNNIRVISKELLSVQFLDELDKQLGLSFASNEDIMYRWIDLNLDNKRIQKPLLTKFLSSTGRAYFHKIIYQKLAEVDKALARQILDLNKHFYHPISISIVESILKSE